MNSSGPGGHGAVRGDPLWRRPCRGYNLLAIPAEHTIARLAAVQRRLLAVEPALLRCPPATLHVSVLPLLAVRREYGADKDALWRERGPEWLRLLREGFEPSAFRALTYRTVVVTDSAVIVLLEPTGAVQRLRRRLLDALRLPPGGPAMPDLVHTTLFRYGPRPPRSLEELRDRAGSLRVDIPLHVREHVVARELVYPHLEAEIMARLG